MKKNDIGFVVASSNQYEKLKEYFIYTVSIIYIADNGSKIVDGKRNDIHASRIEDKIFHKIIESLEIFEHQIDYLHCGNNGAYVKTTISETFPSYKNKVATLRKK